MIQKLLRDHSSYALFCQAEGSGPTMDFAIANAILRFEEHVLKVNDERLDRGENIFLPDREREFHVATATVIVREGVVTCSVELSGGILA